MISRHATPVARRCLQAARRAIPLVSWRTVPSPSRLVQHKPAGHSSRRHYATPPPQLNTSSALSMDTYHAYSDATMETLLDSLEALIDTESNPEYEVEYSSGVLTLKLGEHGTYVINKQPPNKQIWLSSPTSGPKRYDYVAREDEWVYSRDGVSIGSLLNAELTKAFGREIDLGVHKVAACIH